MAGYIRQNIADITSGSTVRAAPINSEFNQVRDAFSEATGHKHDGTSAEGPIINMIGDSGATAINKVQIDENNNKVSFYSNVNGGSVAQVHIADGKIEPETDNDIDLGSSAKGFKNLYLDGTANVGSISAATATISGGSVNGTAVGASTPSTGAFTTVSSSGQATLASADINGGTIDGSIIGASTAAAASFTTISSSGQATLASADINGGTLDGAVIGGATPAAVTGTTVTANNGFNGVLSGNVTGNLTGNVTGNLTGNVTGDVTGNLTASSGTTTVNNLTVNGTVDFTNTALTNLAAPSNASDAATKSYVDTEVSNLVDSAPGALNTLNELATALGDDANFSTTITNSVATKLPLAGGTMTGDIAMGSNTVTGLAAPSSGTDAATKTYVDTATASNLAKAGGTMTGALAMSSNKITGLGTPTAAADATTKGYVDGILGSTTAAATSAANAATSATNAATSATNAANSATAVGASQTASANSAAASAGSATASANESTDSANSATASAASATTASTQATNAASSATTAATQAALATTNGAAQVALATTQANNAASSASTATTQATASASSATTSTTQATNSANSATASANSASSASNAQTAAESARDAALAAYDNFDDRYLGTKSTAPTVDNDGDALVAGALYFDSVAGAMYVYTGSAWVAAYVSGTGFLSLTGGTMTGDIVFADDDKAIFGAGSDLTIRSDGANALIQGSGTTYIRGSTLIFSANGGAGGFETGIRINEVSAETSQVELYYDNGLRLETIASGIDVTGSVVADGLTVDTNTLHVDSTNNRVGIGTASPSAILDIESTAPDVHINDSNGVLGGSINSRVIMQASGSTHGVMGFGTGGGTMALTNNQGSLYLQADTNNAHTSSLIAFTVDNSEKMRILSNGTTGIGTSTPNTNSKFHVSGGRSYFASNSNPYATYLRYDDSTAGVFVGSPAANEFQVSTSSGALRLKVDAEGRLTSSGTGSGDIGIFKTSANSGTGLYINSQTTNQIDLVGYDGSSSNSVNIRAGGATGAGLTVNTSNNVGIGTKETSLFNAAGGQAKLVVTGSSADTNIAANTDASIVISNTNTTAGNTSGLHFARADTDDTPNFAGASIVGMFPDTQVTGQYPRGELAFLTSNSANAAPTEAMRIRGDAVGIGTTAPSGGVMLDVRGTGVLQLVNTDTVQLLASNGGSTLKNVSNNPLIFGTNNTERGRFTSFGDVGIGRSDPQNVVGNHGGGLVVRSAAGRAASTTLFCVQSIGSNSLLDLTEGGQFRLRNSSNTQTLLVDTSGNLTATGDITAFSDERLKSDITTIDGALDKVTAMRGVTFTKDGEVGSGVIAQELEKIAPELVMEGEEYKSVAYGNLVGYLIEAVKELSTKVEELENGYSNHRAG